MATSWKVSLTAGAVALALLAGIAAAKSDHHGKLLDPESKGHGHGSHGKPDGGRGHGEPVRLMLDLEENHEFVEIWVHEPGRKLLVAATSGHGFIVPEDEMIAMTRKGKQVLNVDAPAEAITAVPAEGDMVAAIGENRKMLIFPLEEVNEMTRGKGVILQRYKDGGLCDLRVFNKADGLTWSDSSGREFNRSMSELKDWVGARAQAGRLPPQGFPRHGKFGRDT